MSTLRAENEALRRLLERAYCQGDHGVWTPAEQIEIEGLLGAPPQEETAEDEPGLDELRELWAQLWAQEEEEELMDERNTKVVCPVCLWKAEGLDLGELMRQGDDHRGTTGHDVGHVEVWVPAPAEPERCKHWGETGSGPHGSSCRVGAELAQAARCLGQSPCSGEAPGNCKNYRRRGR